MKNFLFLLLCFVSTFLVGCGEKIDNQQNLPIESTAIENPDFRNVQWGMSMEEVKQQEGKPVSEGETFLGYDGIEIGTHTFSVMYDFMDNQLVAIRLLGFDDYNNPLKYIEEYDTISEIYSEKYGSGKEVIKVDSPYTSDPKSELGFPLTMGYVIMMNKRETERTGILNILSKTSVGDYTVYNIITYESKELYPLFEEKLLEERTKNI